MDYSIYNTYIHMYIYIYENIFDIFTSMLVRCRSFAWLGLPRDIIILYFRATMYLYISTFNL